MASFFNAVKEGVQEFSQSALKEVQEAAKEVRAAAPRRTPSPPQPPARPSSPCPRRGGRGTRPGWSSPSLSQACSARAAGARRAAR